MSWARIVATGSGSIDYRLEIAGCQQEWTTNARITHADGADDRAVFPGLQYSGLKISEKAILKDCWNQVAGMTVKIKPTTHAQETIDVFTRTPVPLGYLAALDDDTPGLNFDSTSIVLDNGLTLQPGFFHVASECFYTDGGTNVIERAKWGTTAQNHYIVYGASSSVSVPVYAYPPTLEGRRATLYVYGQGDDPAGDGTAIWRGIVSRPPRQDSDGITWTIQLDPVTKSFDQRVAAAEGREYRIRGIYHHANAPMKLSYFYRSGSLLIGTGPHETRNAISYVTGFFETPQDFMNGVNTSLAAVIAAQTAERNAIEAGEENEVIVATYSELGVQPLITCTLSGDTAPSSFHFGAAGFEALSYLEGWCSHVVGSVQRSGGGSNTAPSGQTQSSIIGYHIEHSIDSPGYQETVIDCFGDASGDFATPVGKDQPATPVFTYPLSPSRALLGSVPFEGVPPQDASVIDTWPSDRLYLQAVDGLEVDDILLVKNGDRLTPIKVTAVNITDRYVTADIQSGDQVVYFDAATKLVPVRVFSTGASIATFVQQLQDQAVNANDGDTPYVPSVDVQQARFDAAIASADDYWANRNYIFLKPTPIKQIVQEELKAIGWMLRIEADGTIGACPLPLIAANQDATAITEADILLPARGQVGMWPGWEAQSDGLVNSISVRLGYSAAVDDFDTNFDFSVRSVSSIAEHKSNGKGEVEIAPRSTPTQDSALLGILSGGSSTPAVFTTAATAGSYVTPQTVATWVAGYLRVLSMDYAMVTIAVPFRFFDLLVGDLVEVTCSLIPNGAGSRGIVSKKAAVVGREWNLDPAANGMGVLTLYFPREVSSGYAPSGHVTSQSNVGGNEWDCVCSAADTLNQRMSELDDGDVVKHFAVGDKVQIVKRNDGLFPTTVTGAVTFAGGETIRIAFDAAWTPGSDEWVVQYQPNTSGTLTVHQLGFSFVARANVTMQDGSYALRYL